LLPFHPFLLPSSRNICVSGTDYIIYKYQKQQKEVKFIRKGGNHILRIRELREQARLNQEGLALKLNVSQSTISAYEVGDRTPDLEMLISMANIFHVALDYLVGLSDIRQPMQESNLKAEEIDVLSLYRSLSMMKQVRLRSYLEGLSFE